MLAKASHDLRDPYTAMTHARSALLCAKNAEHPALKAWVHGLQSLITYWAQRPREALDYAQAGQDISGLTGSVKIWLASLEARAWSALGSGLASGQAMERAADLREGLTPDDLDDLGGMCYFSRPRQLYYAADAAASLVEAQGQHSKQTGPARPLVTRRRPLQPTKKRLTMNARSVMGRARPHCSGGRPDMGG